MNTRHKVQSTPTQFATTPTARLSDLLRQYRYRLAAATTDGEVRAFRQWIAEIDLELEHRAAVTEQVAS
jgi:hypothetical protein